MFNEREAEIFGEVCVFVFGRSKLEKSIAEKLAKLIVKAKDKESAIAICDSIWKYTNHGGHVPNHVQRHRSKGCSGLCDRQECLAVKAYDIKEKLLR